MGSNGILILAIIWLILSLVAWVWAENTVLSVIWLCAGLAGLIIACIKRNKEK